MTNETFGLYSAYYDLLYRDKDYAGESQHVYDLIQAHASKPIKSLMEFGSGTGMHALEFAKRGWSVHGVEMSGTMLARANERVAKERFGTPQVIFQQGDMRSLRLSNKFDACAALFHVLSYQTSDADLNAAFETAVLHLNPEGLFVFDFWYGPAVLLQKPEVRCRMIANDSIEVTRIAQPVLKDEANIVDVNYTIFVKDKAMQQIHALKETHIMRYLFLPEIDRLLETHGLVRRYAGGWMTGNAPSTDTWGVCVVAQKRG